MHLELLDPDHVEEHEHFEADLEPTAEPAAAAEPVIEELQPDVAPHIERDVAGPGRSNELERLAEPQRLKLPVCKCGQPSHVEAFASPRAIVHRAVQNGLVPRPIEIGDLDIGELAARPRSQHDIGLLFYQGGAALGVAIVSIFNWFDQEHGRALLAG